MFDFARIRVMKEYAASGQWPLPIPRVLQSKYRRAGSAPMSRLTRLARRALRQVAPSVGVGPTLPYYYCGDVFRCGTRSWEYPWTLEVLARLKSGQTVLDVGCGSSEFLFQYAARGFVPVGLDHIRGAAHPQSELRPDFVEQWSHLVRFVDAGAEAIPLDSGSIDIVVCLSVMEHVVRREEPRHHRTVLGEMKRVLRKGGLLICTYDTFINPKVVFAGIDGWGPAGWYYRDDIDFLEMQPWDPRMPVLEREAIDANEDTFFVPPDFYLSMGYGTGFEEYGGYHRLTSTGFVLVK
jgi:SAM-dependent methyltransferase